MRKEGSRFRKIVLLALSFVVFAGLGRWLAHRFLLSPIVERKPASQIVTPQQVSHVEKQNEVQNFVQHGWHKVETDPPQTEKLLNDPNPHSNEEVAELQTTLQTSVFAPGDAKALSDIARETENTKTRYLAIDAISRMPSPDGENALAELFDEMRNEEAREQILTSLTPSNAHSQGAQFLVSLLDRTSAAEDSKRMAFNSLVALAATSSDAAKELQNQIPGEWSDRFSEAIQKINWVRNGYDGRSAE